MIVDETKVLGTVITFVVAVFWYFLKNRDKRLNKIECDIDSIKKEYQRTDAAHRDFNLIKELLGDIKTQLNQINNRLDNKQDK